MDKHGDTLLSEEELHAPAREKASTNKVLWIGLALVPIFWIVDVLVDVTFFVDEHFLDSLFSPEPAEMWMRSLTSAIMVGFAVYANRVYKELAKARCLTELALEKRKLAHRETIESDRKLRLILQSTSEGIVAVDVNGNCQMANRSATEMLDWRLEDVIGRNFHDLVHRPDEHTKEQCPVLRDVRTGTLAYYDNDIFAQSRGSALRAEATASPIVEDGATAGAVITFTDVSARKMLERQLEDAKRVGSLGRLAANVAHEFNNVLMGAQPFAELLMRSETTPKAQSWIRQILQSIARGKRITEEVLRFARPADVEAKAIPVQEWFADLKAEIVALAGTRELVLQIPDEPLHIAGDRFQLTQIVMNLVKNACDAMPAGGTLTVKVEPVYSYQRFSFAAITTPDRFVHFTFQDTGSGIEADVLPHIFEPLFTTKKSRGTGLGLAIARQVVGRHAGHIFVESTVGRGTTVHLLIPATTPDPLVAAEEESVTASVPRVGGRILLVEDDETVGAGIAAVLQENGMNVTTVTTGTEALKSVAEDVPDAVVLDIGLPDMDGTEAYRKMVAWFPNLPVIISTGHGDEARLSEFSGTRHLRFLRKPYDGPSLMASLAEAMA